jgi:hypothetical protein
LSLGGTVLAITGATEKNYVKTQSKRPASWPVLEFKTPIFEIRAVTAPHHSYPHTHTHTHRTSEHFYPSQNFMLKKPQFYFVEGW